MINETVLHYKILEKLGQGGMGIVYLAEDTKLERKVAIKFLPGNIAYDSEERERFKIEAKAAAALNHPNISTIHAIEKSGEDTFIVMEFIDGVTLKDKIKTGPLSADEAINVVVQIAAGLEAAHKKGIVHRDIKPANIMITNDGKIKIMDFGLAKVKEASDITKVGSTMGTAAYMSPEQACGEEVDRRTDIWSLGVIAYELLTGKLPYSGEFEQAIIYSIINENPESIVSVRKDVPLKLEQSIMKMLNKERESRYQNLSEILKEFNYLEIKDKSTEKSEDKKTIAVLPFENISPDKEADYFADGLAEELITYLSKIKEIKLVARINTIRYKRTDKDIKTLGRELNTKYIMHGSVRKYMDDLRISVQLFDVSQESQLWGETYKGKLADVFDIQEKVSKEVTAALRVNLSISEKKELTKRPTASAEAFDNYLRGREFLYRLTKKSVQIAIQFFQRAVKMDTRYAPAYAGLSEAYAHLYFYFVRNDALLELAIQSGSKALMYDPTLSEAYEALGLAYFGRNNLTDSLEATRKAIELNPDSYNAYWILARVYHTMDKDNEAVEALEKLILINPEFLQAYQDLLMFYEHLGEKEKYNNTLETALNIYSKYLEKYTDDSYIRMSYAVLLAYADRYEEAKTQGNIALKENLKDPVMMYYGACLFSRLKENDKAVELLRNSVSSGYNNFEWIKREPDFSGIRNEPGYIELMKGR